MNIKNHKDNRGFSLVELLCAITIIGILAAIAIPNLLGIGEGSKKHTSRNSIANVLTVLNSAVGAGSDLVVREGATGSEIVAATNREINCKSMNTTVQIPVSEEEANQIVFKGGVFRIKEN